jgi:hypothetical protein
MYKKKQFTDEELIERVWDAENIKKVASRFAYYEAANEREKSISDLWVSQPENMATASFGRNWGYIVGMDKIEDYYVNHNRFGAVGTMTMKPFTSKLIVEADDGKTAQGMWMGSGYEAAPNSKGELETRWVIGRVAIDFIKEPDGWKIWHMFVGTNMTERTGGMYVKQPLNTEIHHHPNNSPAYYQISMDLKETEYAVFDQIIEYPEREAFHPTIPLEGYSTIYNYHDYPPTPQPYRTFDDAVSYGPEGHPKYKG